MTGADAEEGHEQALVQGLCARGLLSRHALESALARPYDGYHRRIHEKAAALVHGIVSNHAYMDRRFDALQQQQTSNFRWSVGLLATAVFTIIASVAAGTSAIVAAVIGR